MSIYFLFLQTRIICLSEQLFWADIHLLIPCSHFDPLSRHQKNIEYHGILPNRLLLNHGQSMIRYGNHNFTTIAGRAFYIDFAIERFDPVDHI